MHKDFFMKFLKCQHFRMDFQCRNKNISCFIQYIVIFVLKMIKVLWVWNDVRVI